MAVRYAVYFAPDPVSRLWRFGSAVLGYDAATGRDVPFLVPPGQTPDAWAAATEDPRRYGFHATLKAPFELREGASEADLAASLRGFAVAAAPVDLGVCDVMVVPSSRGGGFVALMPVRPPAGLATLERSVVERFDAFRAPLDAASRNRRDPDALSPRQRGHLERFGYPYVLEDFRFHMTLTGRLDAPAPIVALLADMARANEVPQILRVDRLALFRQDQPSARFRIIETYGLGS
jgi:putative phosphonate metabolism protein